MQKIARCTCGKVEVALAGAPILAVACHCDDCQAAGRKLEALPGAPKVLDTAGGTALVLYRRDRYDIVSGADILRKDKLRDGSATNRLVATCCNTPVFASFDRGPFWISVFRDRIAPDPPPLEHRIQTKFAPAGAVYPDDLPRYATFPVSSMVRIIWARIAMALGL